MQIKFALFVVSAYLMNGIFAQSVVGTHEIQATSEQSATATTVPEIGIPPPFTMTAGATQTICYGLTGKGRTLDTSDIIASPTLINNAVPQGSPYRCWQVYETNSSTVWNGLPTIAFAPISHKAIIIALPIVLSLLVVAAIIGGIFVFRRVRSRRAAKTNREWVNRPGGWTQGDEHVEEGTAPKF